MKGRLVLLPPLLVALVLGGGCSDNGNGGGCPSSLPAGAATCSGSDTCFYPAESCPCGSDTQWECACAAGKWQCHHNECKPCDGASPDASPDGPPGLDSCCLPPDGEVDGEVLPEAGPDPCAACKSDEVCVQYFDGTCTTGGPTCVKVSAACLAGSCTPACEPELCPSPYQCQNQVPCGNEAGATLNCYGP